MITTDSIRRLLAIADVARDPYAVAQVATSLLAADPKDAHAAGFLAKAYLQLKLPAAAQRILPATAGGGGGGGGGANGIIPWPSRARRFAANLRALADKSPAGAALVEQAVAALPRYELHLASDGNFQVFDTQAPLPTAWLGGFHDHKAATALWSFNAKETPVPPPMAFDGAGFGWLLAHIAETTDHSFLNYSCALYLFESDPLALAMLLHMHDWQALIAHPRTRWCIADSPAGVEQDCFSTFRPEWSIPQSIVRCHLRPRDPLPLETVLRTLSAQRDQTRDRLKADSAAYYAHKSRPDWHRRFEDALTGRAEPLRVLGITSRYTTVLQHAMAELAEALRTTPNCVMDIAIEPDDHSLENPFIEKIASFKPDLLLQISRLRHENPHLPANVPYLCWDQDNLPCMRTPEATASVCDPNRLTYVAGHGAFHGYVYLNWPRQSCIPCQPAGSTHRYAPRPLTPAERARYACDLSYVSNASGSAQDLRDQLLPRWQHDPHAAALFTDLTNELLAAGSSPNPWTSTRLHALLADLCARRNLQPDPRTTDELLMNAVTVADRAFRHDVLTWAADLADSRGLSLRLYGHGWNRHPRFANYAAGPASQGEELLAIYQASRINLQIIETGFLHSRALDGLAAGGFFLTRLTAYDGLDLPALQARLALSRHLADHPAQSLEEVANSPDPQVRGWWNAIRPEIPESSPGVILRPTELLRGIELFAHLPPAALAFHQFDQIAFTDRDTFAALVTRYLADELLRLSLATQMRQVVLDHFSPDARWKQFLAAVRAGLAS